MPSNNRAWPEGSSFYHYDKVYDRRNVGYHGPTFAYASMPDQYISRPCSASSSPSATAVRCSPRSTWCRATRRGRASRRLIPWNDVGDGSIFNRIPVERATRSELFGDPQRVRAAYGQSIEYSLNALVSFVQHYGDKNLVLVVLGDHQPVDDRQRADAEPRRPISVIAHDPAVLKRIAGGAGRTACGPARRRRSGR